MIAQRTTWLDSNRLRFFIPMIANREIESIRQRVRQLKTARRPWHDECEEISIRANRFINQRCHIAPHQLRTT